MIELSTLPLLKGKKALVTGIANDQSIAYGCAQAFHAFGADLAITYLNEKAEPYVEPLAKELDASIFMPLNLQIEGPLEEVFAKIEKHADEVVMHLVGANHQVGGFIAVQAIKVIAETAAQRRAGHARRAPGQAI